MLKWDPARWTFKVMEPDGQEWLFVVEADKETLQWLLDELSTSNHVEVEKR